MERRLQRLGLGVDRGGVLGLERLANLLDRLLDPRLGVGVDLVAQLGELFLGLVGGVLAVVARLGQLACLASSSAWDSASETMFLISSSESPEPDLISIFCSLPVPRSLAETLRMPFASMSNATSIWGMPRGAGGMPVSWNLPSDLLYWAISRSPCSTWISTEGWLSSAVEKTSPLRVGIVVLRSISFVITPPLVSIPSVSGVTSSSSTSLTSPAEHARLDRGADRHDLVRVDAAVGLLAGELLDLLLHGRHPRHATDEHDVLDLLDALVFGVVDRLAHRRDDLLQQV